MSPVTSVERIASWSCAFDLNTVPDDVKKVAKRCIVDLVGVGIAGATRPQGRRLFDYASHNYAAGSAAVIGFPDRLSPVGAALVNGTVGHLLDFDDTSYTGIMHGTTVVLPAALAAADLANADGRRLLEAFIVGSEVAYAVALLCTHSHYYKGWWSTASLGVFGAAAAAAKALELSELQTTYALALAGVQACGLKVMFGTDAKSYLAGRAAAIGVEAALLASRGHSGPRAVLEGKVGFVQVLNGGVVNSGGIDMLGKVWRLVNPGIFFKRYPVCSAAHAAVELTQQLMRENQLKGTNVQKVICEVPPLVAASLVYDNPATLQEAQFSMPFSVAAILAHGQLRTENLTEAALSDPAMQSQIAKVTMRRLDSLQSEHAPECARVTLVTDDDRRFTRYLGQPKGMPQNPMSDEELGGKFLQCAEFGGLSHGQSTGLLKYLTAIDSAPPGRPYFGPESATASARYMG